MTPAPGIALVTVSRARLSVAPRFCTPVANHASAGALPTRSPPARGGSAPDGSETSRLASSGLADIENPAGPDARVVSRGLSAVASSGLVVEEIAAIALEESTYPSPRLSEG